MAIEEHLVRLREGVEIWNQWRDLNGGVRTDLSGANLREVNLTGANLREVNLTGADLSGADLNRADLNRANLRESGLTGANLREVNLTGADLSGANLSHANLSNAKLYGFNLRGFKLRGLSFNGANLSNADLSNADLKGANLKGVNFKGANLRGVNLRGTNLSGCNLSGVDLRGANLSSALLIASQLLGSNLIGAVLTGACIQDWSINNTTQFDDVSCEYVYLKGEWSKQEQKYLLSNRRPSDPDIIFACGEFAKLFQKALETVDLIFADGIDWKAFFHSFQELRSQYNGENLSIQAIERKSGKAFVIRLEVPSEADKAAIESRAKELYQTKLQLIEEQYRVQLSARDKEIEIYKKQNTDMIEITKILANKFTIEEPKVQLNSNQIKILEAIGNGISADHDVAKAIGLSIETVRYYIGVMEAEGYLLCAKHMEFSGYGYDCRLKDKGRVAVENPNLLIPSPSNATTIHAGNVGFIQSGNGTISHFSQTIGQNADEITRLITVLREQAQQFPDDQRDDALIGLDDLQQDLSTPEKREPNRIKRRIIALLTIVGILGTAITTATDFANNVLELADKAGIPKSELLQYVPNHLPPSNQP